MAIEIPNSADYVEDDSASIISATSSAVTVTAMPSDVAHNWLVRDFGAGYFTGFTLQGEFNVASFSGATGALMIGVSDTTPASFTTPYTESSLQIYLYKNGTAVGVGAYADASGVITGGTTVLVTGVALATPWYYTAKYISGVGRYGAFYLGIFSDSNRTTLVGALYGVLQGAYVAGRYLYAARSRNLAQTPTITATHQNFTVGITAPNVGLVLTDFTTSGADLATYADAVVVTALAANVTQYVYKDDGASYWNGNYFQKGALNITALTSASCRLGVMAVSDTPNTHASLTTAHSQFVEVDYLSATTVKLYLAEQNGSSIAKSASSITQTLGTPLFLKKRRNTSIGTYGTIYLQAYSDPDYTIPFGSEISLTLRENISYRYSYAVQSLSIANTSTITGTFGGFSSTTTTTTIIYTQDGDTITATAAIGSTAEFTIPQDSDVITATVVIPYAIVITYTQEGDVPDYHATPNPPSPEGSIVYTQDSDVITATVTLGNLSLIEYTQDDDTISYVLGNPLVGTISYTQGDDTIGYLIGLESIIETLSWDADTETGLTDVTVRCRRKSDGYYVNDWTYVVFGPTAVSATLVETDTGLYELDIVTTGFQGYYIYRISSPTSVKKPQSIELFYVNGIAATGGLNFNDIASLDAVKVGINRIPAATRVELNTELVDIVELVTTLGTPAGASVSADLATIDAKVVKASKLIPA